MKWSGTLLESVITRMTKTTVGAAYILLGSYVLYSGFVPSRISRHFFDEVGSPVQYIPSVYFAAFAIVGLVQSQSLLSIIPALPGPYFALPQ